MAFSRGCSFDCPIITITCRGSTLFGLGFRSTISFAILFEKKASEMLRNKLNGIAGMVCGALLATYLSVNESNAGVTMEASNKEKVVALLKSFENRDLKPISYINPKKYIQHNLAVRDGL
ncbi:hypothetical protein [Thiolapillus sp.]